jgi:2-polyprenyl-6-methoxyphenol hydroxylase-like FAD-dependent oxidoreductase
MLPYSEPTNQPTKIVADGMNSVLRKAYGGLNLSSSRVLTGAYAISSSGPLDLPVAASARNANSDTNASIARDRWAASGQAEATSTQDRHYDVFRGNAPVTRQEIEGLDVSFQTWGEGQNKRFATVPMIYLGADGKKEERHVWFITIDDDKISAEKDPVKRRDMLLEEFKDWHDPICQLVRATPPEEILKERALAHRHSQQPVVDFYGLVNTMHKKPIPAIGNGPVIQFVGDAFMTVDPILAQGFTFGIEGAASLGKALSACLSVDTKNPSNKLAFDPYLLRKELMARHDLRLHRLICLLRVTELVQALGQPTTGTLSGWISRDVIRPLMRITPDFIKTPIFNAVLKYSLGLPDNSRR